MSLTIEEESYLQLTDRDISFKRCFVTITQSINAALFLSQANHWTKHTTDPDRWFYKTQSQWQEETGLGRRAQEIARKILCEMGLIQEELRGVPAQLYYRICIGNINAAIRKISMSKVDTTNSPLRTSKYVHNGHTIDSKMTHKNTTLEEAGFELVLKAWNETELPKVKAVTESRKRHLNQRLKSQFWKDNWREALQRISGSDFCKGAGKQGWVANFDFFVRSDDAVVNAMEGKYGQASKKITKPNNDPAWLSAFSLTAFQINNGGTDWPKYRKSLAQAILEASGGIHEVAQYCKKTLTQNQIENLDDQLLCPWSNSVPAQGNGVNL